MSTFVESSSSSDYLNSSKTTKKNFAWLQAPEESGCFLL